MFDGARLAQLALPAASKPRHLLDFLLGSEQGCGHDASERREKDLCDSHGSPFAA